MPPLVDKLLLTSTLACLVCLSGCGGSAPPAAAPEPEAAAPEPGAHAMARPTRPAELERGGAKETVPESVVNVSFEPLVLGVRPGGKFLLAAHFRIAPGYRISWKFPGEVGNATTVEFRAPAGFEVGEVRFPAPEKFTVGGKYVGYGYKDETAVFVEVRAKPNLGSGAVSRFDLDASWVACKKECATERTQAFVELATAYGDARAQDTVKALSPFLERVPKPISEQAKSELRWDTGGRDATLVVKLPGATLKDFISDGSADPVPKKTSFADDEARFVFDEAPRPGSRPLHGVLIASADGKDAFYDLEASLPGAEHGEKKAGPAAKKRRSGHAAR